jgi:hypothetical protein
VTSKRKDNDIKHRIFLVGCPRSGTTLLQSLIASHPDIASFPESHLFKGIYPRYEPKRKLFGLASRQARPHFEQFLSKIGHPTPTQWIHPWTIFQAQYICQFSHALDFLAYNQGKRIWLEKTPDHIFHIEEISSLIAHSKFIHIARNGPDVVASLYQATHQYPQYWGGAWSIDKCIEKWVSCTHESAKYSHKKNHIKTQYEDILENPEETISTICRWLEIDFDKKILSKQRQSESIIEKHEYWKMDANHEINKESPRKFNRLFDERDRDYITAKTSAAKI